MAWTAPELLAGSPPSVTADAYAFGVILFELLTRLRPFDGIAQDAVPLLVAIEGKRPSDYSGIGGFPIGVSFSTQDDINAAINWNPGNGTYTQYLWESSDLIGPKPNFMER